MATLLQTAADHQHAGRLEQAEGLYRAILQTEPTHAETNYRLGMLAVQLGQAPSGLPYLKAATEKNPGQKSYWIGYINALINSTQVDVARKAIALARENGIEASEWAWLAEAPKTADAREPHENEINALMAVFNQGAFAEAERMARALTRRFPCYGFGWKALGAALQKLGRNDDALSAMMKAAEFLADDAELLCNIGSALQAQNRLDEARAMLNKALALKPDHVMALNNLGIIQREQGRFDEAEVSLRRALELAPDHAMALRNLGVVLRELGRPADGEAVLRRSLAISPDNVNTYLNLGVALQDLRRLAEAEACYRKGLEVSPDHPTVLNNLGNTLRDLGRLAESEAVLRKALQVSPSYAEAHNSLGGTLSHQGRFAEAESCYRRALAIDRRHAFANANLLFSLNYHPDKSAEEIFAAYCDFDEVMCAPHRRAWRPHANSRSVQRRLKIGYVSPDFRQHSVRHFLEPLLSHHDKSVVDVYAYAELSVEDQATARYKSYVDHWVPTAGMSDEALAERIRADEIDILVDLAGHTAKNRLSVFARKPAPVSVSWLGYGYTTGLKAIDYLLTDGVSAPEGSENLFSETPWRLSECFIAYRQAEGMGQVSSLPALERRHVTFGTLTRAIRINHRTIRVWAEILKRLPGSRLIVDSINYRDEEMRASLAEKFAVHGISRDRLEIGFHTPPWDVLRDMDIGLDCFPHNSGTTLVESLYMGVPYVTLAGRPSVGRLGGSILTGAGHPEWIATTEEEYVDIAVSLASDLERLSAIRAGLRTELESGPLMDEAGFARRVEAAYRDMFKAWSENKQ